MKKIRQIIMSMLAVAMALAMTACGSAGDMAVSSSPYQNGGMVEPSAAYESMEYEMADSIGMSTGSYNSMTEEGYNPGAGPESGENPEDRPAERPQADPYGEYVRGDKGI